MYKRSLLDKTKQHDNLLWACVVSLIGLNINMLTWDALNFPTIRILFWMLIGIGLNVSEKNQIHPVIEED